MNNIKRFLKWWDAYTTQSRINRGWYCAHGRGIASPCRECDRERKETRKAERELDRLLYG